MQLLINASWRPSWARWCLYVAYILVFKYILAEEVIFILFHFRRKAEVHKIQSLLQGYTVTSMAVM